MSKLAVRMALSVAAASVVLTGLEALRLRRPRVLAQPEPEPAPAPREADVVPRLDTRPRAAPPRAASVRTHPVGTLAMARIHGRVVGSQAAFADLEIDVETSGRSYEPRIEDDGRFEINLPPGSYEVLAGARDEVGYAEAAGLREGEDRELVLMLGEGASISGRVEGCEGPCADEDVEVLGPGDDTDAEEEVTDESGEFRIGGLAPGRTYRLALHLEGKRRLVLDGIRAPSQGLLATLEPVATLTGGFGIAPGEDCPMEEVSVGTPGSEEPEGTAFDEDCRFHFDELPDGAQVHLSASGEGGQFEVDVPIPEHGAPPFLCLRGPCQEPEPRL